MVSAKMITIHHLVAFAVWCGVWQHQGRAVPASFFKQLISICPACLLQHRLTSQKLGPSNMLPGLYALAAEFFAKGTMH
jgi:hypothetical protein